MNLSENTIKVLKNFAQINSNIVIDPGKQLKTIADAKNVFARAEIDDEFPASFGVYDLNEFLAVLGLVDTPVLSFHDTHLVVASASGRAKVKYFYTDTEMLTTPPKNIKLPEEFEITMQLNQQTLAQIKSAAATLGHLYISITPDEGALNITVFDPDNITSNKYSIAVPGTYKDDSFELVMNVNNLRKLAASDYNVSISSKLISVFKTENSTPSIEYVIALEKSSKYGV